MKSNLLRKVVMLTKYTFIGTLLQCIFLSMLLASESHGQKSESVREVYIDWEFREVNILEAFNAIEKKTHYKLLYHYSDINPDLRIRTSIRKSSVADLLLQISAQTDLKFCQINNSINVSRKSRKQLKKEIVEVIVDGITITGKVTSEEDGQGLPGANVLVKGTTTGTVTDVNGNYSIDVPSAETILVFSSVGYVTEEIAVGNRSVINVAMTADITALEEIVVVGYGAVKRSDVTGSLSSVSAEELRAVPVQSISQGLQGRAAGVDVAQTSFRPGENPRIRIRGNRSLSATNNPLIVLDGIPLPEGSGINDFNPADVASIEVLKDASATAIYGSRGANGVILVTTKRGQSGKARVTYDGYVGFSSPLAEIEMRNGAGHAELKREAYRNNSGKSYIYPYADPLADKDLFSQDPNMWESVAMGYEWVDRENEVVATRSITDEEREIFQLYYEQDLIRYAGNPDALARLVDPSTISEIPVYNPENVRSTDWADLVLQTGIRQDHQVSISGGNEDINVIFSGGYFNEKGIQKAQTYDRYNARLAFDYKISDILKVGGSTSYSFSDQEYGSPLYSRAIGQIPLALPYDENGNVIFQPGGDALIFSPLNEIEDYIDNRRVNRIFGSYYADITIMDGLRFRMNFGPDFRHYRRGRFLGALTSDRRGGTSQGIYDQDQRFAYVLENLIYYDKQFGAHTIGLTLLQSIQSERFESSTTSVSDLPYDSQLFYNLGSTNAASPDGFGSYYSLKRLMSWMGRINYTLNNKYLLTVTGRFDGASVLAEGNKWDFFPSFAVAWKAHEEPFLNNADFLDELKIRVGYGKTGNSAVDPYSTQGGLIKTRYVWDNDAAWGFNPYTIPNPELKWESTESINAGIDFGIIDGRVSGTIDVYRQNTTDLIMDRLIPTASGFASIQQNIGATRNQGVELSLSTINVNSATGFRWSTDIIFSKNKEEIVELYGGKNDDIGNRWFIGHPIVTYYDWKPDGIWQMDELDAAAEYGRIPGQNRVVDLDNDKDIDADDRMIIGSDVPDWTGSLVNTLSYKGIEFSFFLYTRQGQTIASGYYRPALAGRYPEPAFIDYWTPANPSNEYPRPRQDQERIDYPEAYLYRDGSFVKLRNVTLGYTFPRALASRWKMQNLRVYVTAFNPLLWTDFEAGDPEFAANATREENGRQVPITNVEDQLIGNNLSTKTFVFGVNLAF